ncbi:flagellar assembly peptidoglycan hydrolase FlgJ [Ramlibacter sp. MMS24-I3-19]|uniref:flagellar assembly peptidoglycan hydrolase FlgJ n=1 Tax=Ramlibacter sp. MMS24-I3-19 TaxID=3416606 RepID=UPI003D051DD4
MRLDPTAGSTGLDARELDGLRNKAATDPRAASHAAAVQFESLFMQMVVKSMRDASPKSEDGGSGGETFTGMLDTQFGKQFAGRPGGLADVLEKQLTKHMQSASPASAASPVAAATAAAPTTAPATHTAHGSAPSTSALPSLKGLGDKAAAFLRDMLPHAQEAERRTGVPASFILGQAALESGWGKGEMKNADGSQSFNLFGVKATAGWTGKTTNVTTTEYAGAQAVKQKAAFRSYASYADAFADYARMLAGSSRYANVVRTASTAEQFAGGMQRAGYATDPHYASKLARTINHTLALQRALG